MLDNLASFVTQLLMFCSLFLLVCWVVDNLPQSSSSEPDWLAQAEAPEDDRPLLRNVPR